MTQFDTRLTDLASRLRIEDRQHRAGRVGSWDSPDASHFPGQVIRKRIDELCLSEVAMTASSVRHSHAQAARAEPDLFSLKLQLEGTSIVRQDGREAYLHPGDLTMCDSTRPYGISCEEFNRMLVVGIPQSMLRRHLVRPERLTALNMPGGTEMNALLAGFLRSVWQMPEIDPAVASNISHAVLNLVVGAYALVPQAKAGRVSMAAVHRLRIGNYLDAHLADPALSPARIAEACNIKLRYLRKLYANSEETLSEYILRRRLEECAVALKAPAHGGRSITEVSFAHGFNSVSHFGRVFRERYGMTPREYRNCATPKSAPIPPQDATRGPPSLSRDTASGESSNQRE